MGKRTRAAWPRAPSRLPRARLGSASRHGRAQAVFRTLVVEQTEEGRLPDTAIARPLGKTNAAHEPRLDPVVPASGRRSLRKRRCGARQRPELLDDERECPVVEARAHLRDVDQLAALVEAQMERAEVSARALGYGVAADDELLLELALDLEPLPRAPGDVEAVALLGDHALEPLLAGGVEEFGAVALDVIAVSDDAARGHQESETLLARLERQSAQIAAVQPERVEGDHADRHLGARPLDVGRT